MEPRMAPAPAGPMDTEPAREIGRTYTGRQDVHLFVTTIVALAAALGLHIAPGVSDQVLLLADLIIPVAVVAYARIRVARNATDQAETTRGAVYSPATVATLTGRPTHLDTVRDPRLPMPEEE